MFVNDTWLNTEMTIYQLLDGDDSFHDIQARSRSRHQVGCSFGNYLVKWTDTRDGTANPRNPDPAQSWTDLECEVLHPKYRKELDRRNWPAGSPGIRVNQWVGFKQITRTITASGHVKVEGYVNHDITKQTPADWIKTNEFTFTGDNVTPPADEDWPNDSAITNCNNQGDGQADKAMAGEYQYVPIYRNREALLVAYY